MQLQWSSSSEDVLSNGDLFVLHSWLPPLCSSWDALIVHQEPRCMSSQATYLQANRRNVDGGVAHVEEVAHFPQGHHQRVVEIDLNLGHTLHNFTPADKGPVLLSFAMPLLCGLHTSLTFPIRPYTRASGFHLLKPCFSAQQPRESKGGFEAHFKDTRILMDYRIKGCLSFSSDVSAMTLCQLLTMASSCAARSVIRRSCRPSAVRPSSVASAASPKLLTFSTGSAIAPVEK